MEFEEKKITDFKVEQVKRNTCQGCWFAEQRKTRCHDLEASEFVKEVFTGHGNTTGNCSHLIAVLKDEVNK